MLLPAAVTLILSLIGCSQPAAAPTITASATPSATRTETRAPTPTIAAPTAAPTRTPDPTEAPTATVAASIDCPERVHFFLSEIPSAFDSLEAGIAWCEACVDGDGLPTLSVDIGPFCNPITSDGGTICTDSKQCEGICLAQSGASDSGRCSDTERVIGCVFEMTNEEPLEICFD
jgi:hypothetical protein